MLAALVAFGLYTSADTDIGARVALRDVSNGPGRWVEATVDVQPADAAASAEWFDVTAWQGGGLIVDRLERVGPGRYRTTEPIPVSGNWKTMVRLHEGNSLAALPIYLPRDAAIPVGEIPAPTVFTRQFRDEHKLLQREQTGGSPVVVALAYATVIGIALGLLALLAWALHRLAFGVQRRQRRRSDAPLRPPGRERVGAGA